MAEYIEREALLQDIEAAVCFMVKTGTISAEMRGANKIIDRIKCAPAADVEPVVRCKDCAVWSPPLEGTSSLTQMGKCEYTGYAAEADDYCSFADFICGERNNDETAILKQALDTYGAEAQTLMRFEEMAELQKELVKHERGADNVPHIAEEIADVQIMLDQMTLLFDCAGAVQSLHSAKVARLAKRLDAEQSAACADAGEEVR